jgi:hypothetical protein
MALDHGPTPGHPGGTQKPTLRIGNVVIEVNKDMGWVTGVSLGTYREPPDQAQFLLVFHELEGVGMCINGRQYLGNTRTLVAGAQTRMRFGVAGMGEAFHTFHIHGHRWVVPGPSGKTPTAIEQSPQTEPTSSFEDTKVFGPGTSFAFTLEEGTGLFRADPPFGEWHMHCHVPMHMMHGMAGSLLVIKGGELAMPLPEGQGCPPEPPEPDPPHEPQTFDVHITDTEFKPSKVFLVVGDSVRWINDARRPWSEAARRFIQRQRPFADPDLHRGLHEGGRLPLQLRLHRSHSQQGRHNGAHGRRLKASDGNHQRRRIGLGHIAANSQPGTCERGHDARRYDRLEWFLARHCLDQIRRQRPLY